MPINCIRKNISVPEELVKDWSAFARSIGQDFSGLVKLAIMSYIETYYQKKENQTKSLDPDFKKSIEIKLDGQFKEFKDLIDKQNTRLKEPTKSEVETQITEIIVDHPQGIAPKKIATYTGRDQMMVYQVLGEMKQTKTIETVKGLVYLLKKGN